MRIRRMPLLLLLLPVLVGWPAFGGVRCDRGYSSRLPETDPGPGRVHEIHFPNTDHELHVFHISGRRDGPTLLIIGGMHGDEPGGYLAADLYADLTLRTGNLIIVPRANIYSIHQNTRGVRGDLNRLFGVEEDHSIDDQIAGVLEELMAGSDGVLNLHDGSGFYRPRWENDLRNPSRWGQSVIIDAEVFTRPDGRRYDLLEAATAVVERANATIDEPEHAFAVKNTRTFDEESPHKEQRRSATCYAVSRVGIPGFGIETSQNIADESLRVAYQVSIINEFLDLFGIVPDHPRFALEAPALRFLAISIAGGPPLLIEDGETLSLPPGTPVTITHVEANYERGLIVDIEGVNGFNDLGRTLRIERDTRVSVRKDKYPCGGITLAIDPSASVPTARSLPDGAESLRITAFRLSVNGRRLLLEPGEALPVLWGDEIVLADPLASGRGHFKINFRGFVGNPVSNDGEDRGYTVRTDRDLLQRFSLSEESGRYEVRAEYGGHIHASAFIEVVEPTLSYLLIRVGSGPPRALADGDTLRVASGDSLQITDVVTRPEAADRVTVNFRGFPGPDGAEDRGQVIHPERDLLLGYSLEGRGRLYEITVTRQGLAVGRVIVSLGDGTGGG